MLVGLLPMQTFAVVEEHTHAYESVVTAPTCTEKGYTTYTCACGDSYVDDYVDATGHKRTNDICYICGDSYVGKRISILGDSISTFTRVSNNANSNSTIGINEVYYSGQGGIARADTWWQQVIDVLDMELLVNNSWSGSCVFQPRKGEASVSIASGITKRPAARVLRLPATRPPTMPTPCRAT